MRKVDELSDPTSCLNKAQGNEPLFVLRAQDNLAAGVVRHWAQVAKLSGVPQHKIDEALAIATEMEGWPIRKTPD